MNETELIERRNAINAELRLDGSEYATDKQAYE
jgi:hypothetical protein